MKTILSLLLVALISLTGCREYIVDPEPPGAAAPQADIPRVQLKGPEVIGLGETYTYKAQDVTGVRYDWFVQGPSGVAGEGDGTRFYRGTAQDTGSALVRVFLRDASDRMIGFAERDVDVVAAP